MTKCCFPGYAPASSHVPFRGPALFHPVDRLAHPRIALGPRRSQVIEPAQDVVVPLRRKGETRHPRVDHRPGPVRSEHPVPVQKLVRPFAHVACPRPASPRLFVLQQSFQHVDGRVQRAVCGPSRAPAVPSPIGHLLLDQMPGQPLPPVVVAGKPAGQPEHQAGDARLAVRTPLQPQVDPVVPVQPRLEQQERAAPCPAVASADPQPAQQQQSVSRRGPLRRIQAAAPPPVGVLQRQDLPAPSAARHPRPRRLDFRPGRAGQVPHRLPPDRRVPRQQPAQNPVFSAHISTRYRRR